MDKTNQSAQEAIKRMEEVRKLAAKSNKTTKSTAYQRKGSDFLRAVVEGAEKESQQPRTQAEADVAQMEAELKIAEAQAARLREKLRQAKQSCRSNQRQTAQTTIGNMQQAAEIGARSGHDMHMSEGGTVDSQIAKMKAEKAKVEAEKAKVEAEMAAKIAEMEVKKADAKAAYAGVSL